MGARSVVVHGYVTDGPDKLHRSGDFESRAGGTRRAVVFYVDKGQFLSYLTWWVSYLEPGCLTSREPGAI